MNISGLGRFVFVAQWIAAVILPAFVILGRAFVGAESGWLVVIGFVYGWVPVVLMLVPPLIALFDREARRARSTRAAYAVTSLVLWGLLLLAGLSVPDAGDSGPVRPALTVWTGGAIGIEAASAIFTVCVVAAGVAYLALLVLAVAGAIRGRRPPSGR